MSRQVTDWIQYSDRFETASDRDWFLTSGLPNSVLVFNGSDGVGSLSVYDGAGRLLATDADGRDFRFIVPTDTPAGALFYLTATAAGPGAYTISIGRGANAQSEAGAHADDGPFAVSTWTTDHSGMI